MSARETKYYILGENLEAQNVSLQEHEEWCEKNASKFNRSWKQDDVKEAYLYFVGTKEFGENVVLFEVETLFFSYDRTLVSRTLEQFTRYRKAVEYYEKCLFLNRG